MKQKKKWLGILLIVAVLLLGIAGYLYFRGEDNGEKKELGTSDTNTMEEKTTEGAQSMNTEQNTTVSDNEINKELTTDTDSTENVTTTEKKKELPDNYVWDTARLGEPPQIVYDFAENQERFDYIVEKVDSIVGEGDGFSTGIENNKIYYDSAYKNIDRIKTGKFTKNVTYLFNNTKFYEFTKDRYGYWIMHYNQEENRDRFIFIMAYIPEMTDEQAYEEGYYRVVGDWFFGTIWKI